jgi:hypothetical protein
MNTSLHTLGHALLASLLLAPFARGQVDETTARRMIAERLAEPVFKQASWHTDFAAALAAARQDGKVVFAYFCLADSGRNSVGGADAPDTRFERDVLATNRFVKLSSQVVLFVGAATSSPQGWVGLPPVVRVAGLPAVRFLDQDGSELLRRQPYEYDLAALERDVERLALWRRLRADLAGGARFDAPTAKRLFQLELDLQIRPWSELEQDRRGLELSVAEAARIDQELVDLQFVQTSADPRQLTAMWRSGRIPSPKHEVNYWSWLMSAAWNDRDRARLAELLAQARTRPEFARVLEVFGQDWEAKVELLELQATMAARGTVSVAAQKRLFLLQVRCRSEPYADLVARRETLPWSADERAQVDKALAEFRAETEPATKAGTEPGSPSEGSLWDEALASIRGKDEWDHFTTRRLLVLWERTSTSPRAKDVEQELTAARARADAVERRFDACEVFLPPHGAMRPIRCLLRLPAKNEPLSGHDSLRRAREGELYTSGRGDIYWAVYEQAWFGVDRPGRWYSLLAIAFVDHAIQVDLELDGSGGKPRVWAAWRNDFKKLKRSDCIGLLAGLQTGPPGPFDSADGSDALVNRAWAAFLAFGPQQERKWDPRWSSWLAAYADAVRRGESDVDARRQALADIDAKAFEEALARWAPRAK